MNELFQSSNNPAQFKNNPDAKGFWAAQATDKTIWWFYLGQQFNAAEQLCEMMKLETPPTPFYFPNFHTIKCIFENQ